VLNVKLPYHNIITAITLLLLLYSRSSSSQTPHLASPSPNPGPGRSPSALIDLRKETPPSDRVTSSCKSGRSARRSFIWGFLWVHARRLVVLGFDCGADLGWGWGLKVGGTVRTMNRSRWNRDMVEDLELRLAPSTASKGGMLANNCLRGYPSTIITIDDDDEDDDAVQVRMFFPRSNSWAPPLTEEDLELRLGLGAHCRNAGSSYGRTKVCEDGIRDPHARKCSKNKIGQTSSSHGANQGVEIKLRCAICMDTMKEETSTICGHIFCKPCITNAVLVQRKCPACRTKLSIQNIHRIYLPGSTS
ncbi:hypothetical protein Taro_029081, partial [Colocasia esculenta]|nr:hypothetical protein [Colocasia esculenta]